MHGDVFNVGPGEVVLLGDFKQNINLPLEIDQEGYQFFENQPITCLSVVAHSCNDYGIHVKRVYTLLSRCLTYTTGFVLKCLKIKCARLPQKAKKLEIQNFKKSLCFMKQDGMLVASPVSAADESEKMFSPFSFKVESVANKIKTQLSTK
ncbi:MAG: hypothetical protein EZS28_027828 [Streblomastix strix]|uniref:Uncharacterized protein n=1 Tax=Streblomastix strix TaxID=222440 RepID=A0A5J4V2B7_9EUKA|nr:MAG: hypothetical protein EZS28_027828 [Streblomastix strix]